MSKDDWLNAMKEDSMRMTYLAVDQERNSAVFAKDRLQREDEDESAGDGPDLIRSEYMLT